LAFVSLALLAVPIAQAHPALDPPAPSPGPSLTYVTQTARSPATVWLTGVKGGARIRPGIGDQPVIAPSGQQVAASLYARRVTVRGRSVVGAEISGNGRTLLIEERSFLESASARRVARVPFGGGRSRVLVSHGAEASWNA
jgi:hypothetical protein